VTAPAVGIEDAHEHIGAGRRLERDELIAADPLFAVGDGPHRLRPKLKRARARVEHDEVVAEPVHLAEGDGMRLHEGFSPVLPSI
jgi:hypothetical protein